MKTQNKNRLDFNKKSIVELNDNQLQDVNGGHPTTIITTSSFFCGFTAVVLASVVIITSPRP